MELNTYNKSLQLTTKSGASHTLLESTELNRYVFKQMRENMKTLSIVLFICISSVSYAETNSTNDNRTCEERAQTNIDFYGCKLEEKEKYEKILVQSYDHILALINDKPKKLQNIKKAQEMWLKFRDVNCETYSILSMSRSDFSKTDCEIKLTKNRASELTEFSSTLQELSDRDAL